MKQTSDRLLLPLLVLAGIFDQYDVVLLSLLLPHVQADLDVPDALLGPLGGIVRAGSLLAPFLILGMKPLGVRRAFLWTVIGFSISTAVAGAAVTVVEFTAAQVVTRTLVAAEGLLTMVVLVDAYPPGGRGRRVGLIGALGTLGTVAGYLAYPLLIDNPLGWRAMYIIAIAPALLLWLLRHRWLTTPTASADAPKPLSVVERSVIRRRTILLAIVLGVWAAAMSPALFFVPKYLHDEVGWSPARIGFVVALVTLLAAPAPLIGGWLSDRVGRRPVVLVAMVVGPLSAAALFLSASELPVAAVGLAMGWSLGTVNALGILRGAEMSSSDARTGSTALVGGSWIAGGAAGLGLQGLLYALVGSHQSALICLMALGLAAASAALLLGRHSDLLGGAPSDTVATVRSAPSRVDEAG